MTLPARALVVSGVAGALALAPAAGGGGERGAGPPGTPARAPILASAPLPGPAYGTYAWPVRGPVIRPFEPPGTPYGAGHRGIDVAVSPGTPVRAAEAGVVAFAGRVAGSVYVSVDHPDGVRTTYSFLSSTAVSEGDSVARGDLVGASGEGHAGVEPAHVHLGARFAGDYIDPLLLFQRLSLAGLVRLAPLEEAGAPAAP